VVVVVVTFVWDVIAVDPSGIVKIAIAVICLVIFGIFSGSALWKALGWWWVERQTRVKIRREHLTERDWWREGTR